MAEVNLSAILGTKDVIGSNFQLITFKITAVSPHILPCWINFSSSIVVGGSRNTLILCWFSLFFSLVVSQLMFVFLDVCFQFAAASLEDDPAEKQKLNL